MGNGAGKHHIHIANNTEYEARILISPNKDYVFADLFVNFVSIFVSGYGLIKSASTLWMLWNLGMFEAKKIELAFEILKFFEKHGLPVKPHAVRDVYDHAMYNPLDYLTVSGWAALCGGKEVSITILLITPEGNKMAQFDSNSDWSWIIHEDEVNRSVYGTLWQDDHSTQHALKLPAVKSGSPEKKSENAKEEL